MAMKLQTSGFHQRITVNDVPEMNQRSLYWPPRFRHLIKDVKVHTPTGLTFFEGRLINQSGQIFEEAHSSALQNRVGRPPDRVRTKFANEEYFVVPTIHAYWHWAVEWLPRVLGMKAISSDVTVLTTFRQPSYVKQGLELAGVSVEYVDKVWINVDSLWIVDKAFFGFIHPDDSSNLREFCKTIASNFESTATLPSKVYVSRKGFARSMSNETELEEWLESVGFAIFRVNEMASLQEQARLFSSAELLVGPTGSSLSNVVFMPPGSKAIELAVWLNNWPECESLSASSGVAHEKVLLKATRSAPYGDGREAIRRLKEIL